MSHNVVAPLCAMSQKRKLTCRMSIWTWLSWFLCFQPSIHQGVCTINILNYGKNLRFRFVETVARLVRVSTSAVVFNNICDCTGSIVRGVLSMYLCIHFTLMIALILKYVYVISYVYVVLEARRCFAVPRLRPLRSGPGQQLEHMNSYIHAHIYKYVDSWIPEALSLPSCWSMCSNIAPLQKRPLSFRQLLRARRQHTCLLLYARL